MKKYKLPKLVLVITCSWLVFSCGGAPGESGGVSGSGSSGGGGASSNNRAVTVDLGDSQVVQEQTSVTLTPASVSSTEGDIESYAWSQVPNGAPSVVLVPSGSSVTFDLPDVRRQENVVLLLTATDSAGNTGSSSVTIEVTPDTISIAGMPLMYSQPPKLNEGFTLSVGTEDVIGDIDWLVVSAPVGSSFSGATSSASALSFIPDTVGEYSVRVTAEFDDESIETTFTVVRDLEFDEDTIKGQESTALNQILDIVESQSWVSSAELSVDAVSSIVETVEGFTVVGVQADMGVLVEYDGESAVALDAIEELRLLSGIDNVSSRLFEGDDVPREEVIPNDGSAFDDLGDNWHLEYINAPEAWDITTGSSDVVIGVSDTGFNVEHADISGRVFELLTDEQSVHGTHAVGTIGAQSNNGTGITGINWVSDLLLTGVGLDAIQGLFKSDSVKVVSSAWAIPGYISSTFDPLDAVAVGERDEYSIEVTRSYRRLAQSNLERLFVWPAGNGIGNGQGNTNSIHGVKGIHHSPALHYDDKMRLVKQGNVVFAGAVLPDGRLAYYSNYGEAVDLAAPTSFRSTALNDGFDESDSFADGDSGYAGTSASASVVSGVASLIYSLNPDFTGAQVKSILIRSASALVTERYTTPGSSETEALDTPIPIVDAEAALLLAQQIINDRIVFSYSVPNPFVREAEISVLSEDELYEVVSIDWTLASSADGESSWQVVSNNLAASNSFSASLDSDDRYHRVTADVVVSEIADGSQSTVSIEEFFSYSEVGVTAVETVTLDEISGVSLVPDLIDGADFGAASNTNGSGQETIYVVPGSYKLRGSSAGYEDAATRFTAYAGNDLNVVLVMSPDAIDDTGALSGFVEDEDGAPLENAVVRISGGQQTNGFFASVLTSTNGYFVFSNLSKLDSAGSPIESFLLEASLDDYSNSIRNAVRVVSGEDTTENLVLLEPRPYDDVFVDDFESGVNDWVATGFWNQVDLVATDIANSVVDNGNTSLPTGETGPQALLPEPVSGAVSWWYGEVSTGSFIGVNTSAEDALTGGTSDDENEGTLQSPEIDLVSATTPFLRFRTWWEIESVNPNSNGYDLLEVQISIDDGASYETLRLLNPFVDPNDTDRDHKPFTTAGFNRQPLWVVEEIDLTEYAGRSVLIRFSFDTVDALYNGFRGWILDDLIVGDYTLSVGGVSKPTVFESESYQQYLELHKKPQVFEYIEQASLRE
ncbi:MAG: S8 family serine peptidase [Agarilytica sp.]